MKAGDSICRVAWLYVTFRRNWGFKARNKVYDIKGPVFVREASYETIAIRDR